jgi:Rrf2 family transcriptional regulator, repressor of oqxAB
VVDLRFSTALQLMLSLALAAREGVPMMSSFDLAEGLAANPSLVRKLIVPLVQAGLLSSTKGKLGGVALARSPKQITLADIYGAVLPERKMFFQRTEIPHRCLVSSNIGEFLGDLESELEGVVHGTLSARTLEQSLDELRDRSARRGRSSRRVKA